jgi:hypothetical protein
MSPQSNSVVVEEARMSSIPLGKSLSQPPKSFSERMLRPFRIVLCKIMAPMMGREEELFASLEIHIEQIEHQQRRLDALVRQVGTEDTNQRLIACEERLQELESLAGSGRR